MQIPFVPFVDRLAAPDKAIQNAREAATVLAQQRVNRAEVEEFLKRFQPVPKVGSGVGPWRR